MGIHMDGWGHMKAIDPASGREVWSWKGEHPMLSSVLATTGDLVFAHGSPMTYSVNGKQYVAVPTGWGGWVEGYAPEMYGAPRGTALFVFALP